MIPALGNSDHVPVFLRLVVDKQTFSSENLITEVTLELKTIQVIIRKNDPKNYLLSCIAMVIPHMSSIG